MRPEDELCLSRDEMQWDGCQDCCEHWAYITTPTIFTPNDAYEAVCTCGWRGQMSTYEQDAQADIRQHYREMEEQ